MSSKFLSTYRSILRELRKSSISTRQTRSRTVSAELRAMFDQHRNAEDKATLIQSVEHAVTFLRAQRNHKALLERYNPLHDLTPEERIKATARRVGLDMPIEVKPQL